MIIEEDDAGQYRMVSLAHNIIPFPTDRPTYMPNPYPSTASTPNASHPPSPSPSAGGGVGCRCMPCDPYLLVLGDLCFLDDACEGFVSRMGA